LTLELLPTTRDPLLNSATTDKDPGSQLVLYRGSNLPHWALTLTCILVYSLWILTYLFESRIPCPQS